MHADFVGVVNLIPSNDTSNAKNVSNFNSAPSHVSTLPFANKLHPEIRPNGFFGLAYVTWARGCG